MTTMKNEPRRLSAAPVDAIVRHLSADVTVMLGDCRDLMPNQWDAIITDPPYGIDYRRGSGGKRAELANDKPILHDDEEFDPTHLLKNASRTTGGAGIESTDGMKGKKPIVIWGANYFSHRLPPGQWLVWDKACGQGPHSSFTDAEYAWTTRKTPRSIYHHLWLGLLRQGEGASGKEGRIHPSQKPVELMEWCMETCRVGIGKTVLDPYMGSGTTGVACIRTGRKFIGIEKDPEYFDAACSRLDRHLRQGRLF